MSLQTKAFVYQLLCFAVLFILSRYLLDRYSSLTGLWIPITAFVIGTLLSPKFQAIKTANGPKMYMKWIFLKGVREVK
ncbi:MAG TPA: hypothetical protein VFQ50_07275 [Flavobacterium sp.]|jgi:hypothetical protein|nr:hypothetical protein [Flavobacterium sp.]